MVVRVTVYDTQVTGLFMPGGDAWKFMGLAGTEHLNAAIAFAPSRSGHLKSSHYPVPILTPYKKLGTRYTIRNDADYAEFVHRGTTGPIMAYGSYLWVPQRRGSAWPRWQARWVAGQKANPWIERAFDHAVAPYF